MSNELWEGGRAGDLVEASQLDRHHTGADECSGVREGVSVSRPIAAVVAGGLLGWVIAAQSHRNWGCCTATGTAGHGRLGFRVLLLQGR